MCSIFGIFGLQAGDDLPALRRQALDLSQRQRHRGPDWSGVYVDDGAILVHERLAIVDPAGGSQPLLSEDGGLALAVNGEIYNHRELEGRTDAALRVPDRLGLRGDQRAVPRGQPGRVPRTASTASSRSRCGTATQQRVLIARDPIGVVPLYWGHDKDGRLRVASEMKSLVDICADVAQFPPGHWYDSATGELHALLRAAVARLRRGAKASRPIAPNCARPSSARCIAS